MAFLMTVTNVQVINIKKEKQLPTYHKLILL